MGSAAENRKKLEELKAVVERSILHFVETVVEESIPDLKRFIYEKCASAEVSDKTKKRVALLAVIEVFGDVTEYSEPMEAEHLQDGSIAHYVEFYGRKLRSTLVTLVMFKFVQAVISDRELWCD